jgi:hypothetical protein
MIASFSSEMHVLLQGCKHSFEMMNGLKQKQIRIIIDESCHFINKTYMVM